MVGLQPVGLRGLAETPRLALALAASASALPLALALALAQACSGVLDLLLAQDLYLLLAQGLYLLLAQGWDSKKPMATKTSD